MGLSATAKNALKIALHGPAANEIIPLLDRLSDELAAEKAHAEWQDATKATIDARDAAKVAPETVQPPVDNNHVAEGAAPFTDEEVTANSGPNPADAPEESTTASEVVPPVVAPGTPTAG